MAIEILPHPPDYDPKCLGCGGRGSIPVHDDDYSSTWEQCDCGHKLWLEWQTQIDSLSQEIEFSIDDILKD